jgi:hypothetical protein
MTAFVRVIEQKFFEVRFRNVQSFYKTFSEFVDTFNYQQTCHEVLKNSNEFSFFIKTTSNDENLSPLKNFDFVFFTIVS